MEEFVIEQRFIANKFVTSSVIAEHAKRDVRCNNCRGGICEFVLRECMHVFRRYVIAAVGALCEIIVADVE